MNQPNISAPINEASRFAGFLVNIAAFIAIPLIAGGIGHAVSRDPSIQQPFQTLLGQAATLLGIAIVCLVPRYREHIKSLLVANTAARTALLRPALAMMAIYTVFNAIICPVLGETPSQWIKEMMAPNSVGGVMALLFTVLILAPITEEILFRGFLLESLRFRFISKMVSDWLAVGMSAAVFGIIHVQYSWVVQLQVGLVGVVLGWVRIRSNSLIPAIALHSLAGLLGMIYHLAMQ